MNISNPNEAISLRPQVLKINSLYLYLILYQANSNTLIKYGLWLKINQDFQFIKTCFKLVTSYVIITV